ncbi:MAG: 16S rRNA (uracil(1498)-N(3))-methyltransferase [Lachnospiraceae bacterium]|nr:16S rRNA (uracil(1498)-N(3))-methyltransferase [Lachnospiraceae bacterium]MBQ6994347.1 16S rRNA (uracil(1498)-N(3))-methyltransferase [Lachnospiraceae bacterium]
MYHFFVEPSQIGEKDIVITGADVNHIKNVIRLKPGDEISVSNGIDGRDYRCGIVAITENEVQCELRFIKEDGVELPAKVYLFQGLPKGDKMELIIQKMVELGVYEIIPVAMQRCVVKLDDKKAKAKIARWQGIAEAAAKQSKRGIVPQIHAVMSYKEALAYAADMDCRLVPYEMEESLDGASGMAGTKKLIETIKPGQSVAIFIGPEGGFEDSEIQNAISQGMKPITLGKRILRTETAGMTAMAWIMYQLEE